MHALHFHSVCTALTTCLRHSDISKNAVQSPCERHGRPQLLHKDHCARLQSSYCIVGDLTAQLWWPHCALIRTLSHSVCFEHALSFGVRYIHTVSTGDVTVLLHRCLRSYCAHLGVLHFSLRLWACFSGVTGVLLIEMIAKCLACHMTYFWKRRFGFHLETLISDLLPHPLSVLQGHDPGL